MGLFKDYQSSMSSPGLVTLNWRTLLLRDGPDEDEIRVSVMLGFHDYAETYAMVLQILRLLQLPYS